MRIHPVYIILLSMIFISLTTSPDMKITFEIVPKTLPDSSSVYITGNQNELGMWHPGAVPLEQQPDGIWRKTFLFAPGNRLEYKITRGSWQTEAVSADGRVPYNSTLDVTQDTTIRIEVHNWKDILHRVEGKITGSVKYHRHLEGDGIKPRDVIVWLPPSYETSPRKRYPVLYMHDGQNILDPQTSFIGVDWQIDETADSLIRQGKIREIIVVGIYNTDDREQEYSDSAKGRAYLSFIVQTLKPFIDKNYRTRKEATYTATMGSSMGGLIAFLLVWNYPDVFSQAGCLSPAFIYRRYNAVNLLQQYQGEPKDIRIYIDNGEVGLEKELQPGCDEMIHALQEKGFGDLEWYFDQEGEHSERAWSKRLWRPLLFMFGKDR